MSVIARPSDFNKFDNSSSPLTICQRLKSCKCQRSVRSADAMENPTVANIAPEMLNENELKRMSRHVKELVPHVDVGSDDIM